jgi:hypothetical protein
LIITQCPYISFSHRLNPLSPKDLQNLFKTHAGFLKNLLK